MAEEKVKNRGGQNKIDLDVEDVVIALQANAGLKTAAAKALNIHRSTLYNFMNSSPEIKARLQAAVEEANENALDLAEGQVLQAIRKGDLRTCRWYLEMRGKGRGFSRRHEVTGPKGGPVQTEAATIDMSGLSIEALKEIRAAALAAAATNEPD